MNCHVRRFVAIAVLCVSTAWAQTVTLEGFVPHGITAALASHEYRRIWITLAAAQRPERSPVQIQFLSKKDIHATYLLPEWGGGGAIGRNHIVVALDGEPFFHNDYMQTTVHELTHIVINRICTTTIVPRWFHEGVGCRDLL